jgi:WD40 repeat protein
MRFWWLILSLLFAYPAFGQNLFFQFNVKGAVEITAASWSPDGKILAVAGEDGLIRLWTGTQVTTLPKVPKGIVELAWSPNGKTLASLGDGEVLLWDVASGRQMVNLVPLAHPQPLAHLCWSHDGQLLACVVDSSSIAIWNVRTGQSRCLGDCGSVIKSMDWGPDDKLVTIAGEKLLSLYDPAEQKVQQQFENARRLCGAAFSPDGRTLATLSEDESLNPKEPKSLEAMKGPAEIPAELTLWDRNTGRPIGRRSFKNRFDFKEPGALSWNPEHDCLVGEDGRAKLWSLPPGQGTASP